MTRFWLLYSLPAVAVVLLWTETSAAAQKPQREPVRVASDVQEAKLIKRVEPMYPQQARWLPVHGPVRLQVVVNERGEVAEAKVISGGNPLIQRPAWEAVRQWRYFPTYMNGEAVPVSTTVEMPFSYPGSGAAVYMMVDETGNLRTAEIDAENKWKIAEEPLPPARLKEIKGPVFLMVAPGVPLTILEKSTKALQDSGLSNFSFLDRGYVFRSGRLYGVGNANGIQPPELNIDAGRLASLARASGRLGDATGLAYHVFIDEAGKIVAVERFDGPEIPDVEAALRQARVITPGRRENRLVPVMITIAMRFQ